MIPVMDKSSAKPNPLVKSPLAKNERYQAKKKDFIYISVIGSLNFITNSTRPEAPIPIYHMTKQLNVS